MRKIGMETRKHSLSVHGLEVLVQGHSTVGIFIKGVFTVGALAFQGALVAEGSEPN